MSRLVIAEVPSSRDPSKKYKVRLDDGLITCSCPAFTFGRTGLYCKHLKQLAKSVKEKGIDSKHWTQEMVLDLVKTDRKALRFSVMALYDNVISTEIDLLARKVMDKMEWSEADWAQALALITGPFLAHTAVVANAIEKDRRQAADQLVLEVLGEKPGEDVA